MQQSSAWQPESLHIHSAKPPSNCLSKVNHLASIWNCSQTCWNVGLIMINWQYKSEYDIIWCRHMKISECTLSKETQDLLYRYFAAAANLYGVVEIGKLLKIYNSQNEPVSEEDFLSFVENMNFKGWYLQFQVLCAKLLLSCILWSPSVTLQLPDRISIIIGGVIFFIIAKAFFESPIQSGVSLHKRTTPTGLNNKLPVGVVFIALIGSILDYNNDSFTMSFIPQYGLI